MNAVHFIGRLTKDLELQHVGNGSATTWFNLAVKRSYKDKNGDIISDFIPIQAWGKLAETMCKFLKKGSHISVSGTLQSGEYTKDGKRVFSLQVVAENFEFLDKKPVDSGGNNLSSDGAFPVTPPVVISADDIPF